MSGEKTVISFRADPGLEDRIDDYAERAGYDGRSEAAAQLARVGLRETRAPVLYRWKDEAVNWAGHLGLAAILVIVVGFTGDMYSAVHGIQVAIVLVGMAVGIVAAVELARTATGQSELSRLLNWRPGQ